MQDNSSILLKVSQVSGHNEIDILNLNHFQLGGGGGIQKKKEVDCNNYFENSCFSLQHETKFI